MLKRRKQLNYFKKRWESILFHLQAFQAYADLEELHRVRVEIKKMRALFLIHEKRYRKKEVQDHFKLITKLFHKAGRCREALINLELMDRYAISNSKTENQQTRILIHESEKLYSQINMYLNYFKKGPVFFKSEFAAVDDKKLEKDFKKEIKKLTKVFAEKFDTGLLHPFRKKLKHLLYRTDIFPPHLVARVKLNTDYARKLEEMIGQWHDLDAAIALEGKVPDSKVIITRLRGIRKKQLKEIQAMTENFHQKIYSVNP